VVVAKATVPNATTPTPAEQSNNFPSNNMDKASIQPWSTSASAKEISDAAQYNFRKWAEQQLKGNASHQTLIQTGTPTTRANNFSAVDTLGTKLFSQYFKGQSTTVIGNSEDWVVGKLRATGEKYDSCAQNAGNGGLNYCLNKNISMGFVVTTDASFQRKNPGADGSSLLAHEYFHLVQAHMADLIYKQSIKHGEKESAHLFPAWLDEGSANFVGFSVAALALDATYWEGRGAMFNYIKPGPSNNANEIRDYEIRNGPGNDSPTYPYIVGQVASEFIVASVGFQKFLDIWLLFPETQDFEKSFEKAVGISKEQFYSYFEKARLNLGLPPVTWKLDCLTNRLLSEFPSNPEPCSWDGNGGSGKSPNSPPPVDKSSNVENLGCVRGEGTLKNNFGTFTCTELPNGNNLWKKTG
jgi:hypothetical protein